MQWELLIVITLGMIKSDHINHMITLFDEQKQTKSKMKRKKSILAKIFAFIPLN
jgi:hypothetical protein